ncbi:MAG: Recombination protein RecR [Parcubacteria group bacterium GW2011_GWA1_40_21]|nr:MAG: Recombination protein RecR [Parcubacteria group bacterium GW2011_GWA1_40_21]
MDKINKLSHLFSEFPGIGPRQAKRFVYFLLARNPEFLDEMVNLISNLKKEIKSCEDCSRFFQKGHTPSTLCEICGDKNRDKSKLMIVSRDIDLETVEKSGSYNGTYFVLGGSIPILDKNPENQIRLKRLVAFLDKKNYEKENLSEIILGLNANPAGEHTAEFLKNTLSPFASKHNIKISTLGRGLSTGTELEYSDSETIKNALKNRA